jgi:predicted amidohydrolase YtcJ
VSTIHRNGRIRPEFTGDDIASAMAVRGSTIVAVGTEAAVAAAVEAGATVIDLNGRCVIPGLTDVHTHVAGHALDEKCVELRDTCDPTVTSVAVMLERMAEVAAIREPGELVIGIGAMRQNTRLAERRWPSLALERGGIDRHTQDPPAGKIERDQETGEATGTLLETAKETVIQDLVSYYSFEQYVDALEAALLRLAGTGITTIHDIIATRDQVRGYQVLHDQGRLPVRVMAATACSGSAGRRSAWTAPRHLGRRCSRPRCPVRRWTGRSCECRRTRWTRRWPAMKTPGSGSPSTRSATAPWTRPWTRSKRPGRAESGTGSSTSVTG